MSLKIRLAKRSDIPNIIKLNMLLTDQICAHTKYSRPSGEVSPHFRKFIESKLDDKNYRILVAEKDSIIIGTLRGAIDKSQYNLLPENIGRISGVFVDEKYRNTGAATKMLENITEWFRENKISTIELTVDSGNEKGTDFWKEKGFKEFRTTLRQDI